MTGTEISTSGISCANRIFTYEYKSISDLLVEMRAFHF